MRINIITDKYSKEEIKNNISKYSIDCNSDMEIIYTLDVKQNNISTDNYMLVVEDELKHAWDIMLAASKSNLFDELVFCDSAKMAEFLIDQIHITPMICTLDFQLGLVKDIYKDISSLYNKIKEKFNDAIVIGYTQFENTSNTNIGDQAGEIVKLLRSNKDSVYDKFGMSIETLSNIFRDKIQLKKYKKEIDDLREIVEHLEGFEDIIGTSRPLKEILKIVSKVAPTESTVMITGENGTGKELVAKAIHKGSLRDKDKYISVNCASIPSELIESELFGHIKGAFTGAEKDRIGKFELAEGGTLFLDEIGDMKLDVQAKVLRAIQEREIERVGDNKKIKINCRIISATNKNLVEEVVKGNFREDLYHRLAVIPINLPPLRERKEDIPLLIQHFSKEICMVNKYPPKTFTKEAMNAFQNYSWKGNIRELRNIVERIVILSNNDEITDKEVKNSLVSQISLSEDYLNKTDNFLKAKEIFESAFIVNQLKKNNWDKNLTAEVIGITMKSLQTYITKYNLSESNVNTYLKIFDDDACNETEIFLDKIEEILVEHFGNDSTVTQEMFLKKFTSTKTGKANISRQTFTNDELNPRKSCIKKLMTTDPQKWPNTISKCQFIINIVSSKK